MPGSTDTVPAPPDGTVSIREAAERFGLAPSALRHYDDLGLVTPAARRNGTRMYGPAELRRLALVALSRRLGIRLAVVSAILDGNPRQRRQAAKDQRRELRRLVEQAEAALSFLDMAAGCRHQHPARECPGLTHALDLLAAGLTLDDLAGEHGRPAPPPLDNQGRSGPRATVVT